MWIFECDSMWIRSIYAWRDHDLVQQLKSDRDEMEMKMLIFNENLNERIDLVNKKTIKIVTQLMMMLNTSWNLLKIS